MLKVKDCLRQEYMLDHRKRLSLLLPIVTIIIGLLVFGLMMPDGRVMGDSVATSSWATEIFIICGIISGFIHQSRELPEVKEIMISENAYRKKKTGKILWMLIEGLVILAISALICVVFMNRYSAPKVLYRSTICYILFYWILPFLVAGIASMVITDRIEGKLKYLIFVILMVFQGPLLPTIASPLVNMDTYLYKYFCIFNLGPINTIKPLNVMFGYDLQPVKLIIGIIAIIGFGCMYFIDSDDMTGLKFTLSAIALSCLVLYLTMNFIYISNKLDYEVAEKMDRVYENEDKGSDWGKGRYIQYDMTDMEISLRGGNELKLMARVGIIPANDLKAVDFVLYHDFNIAGIFVNGKKVKYERVGDVVRILNEFTNGKKSNIIVKYSGRPAVHMYSDENKWFLPAYLAWYPKKGDTDNIVYTDDLYELNFREYDHSPMKFRVRYLGKGSVFCSLKQVRKNQWLGSSDGVSLLCSEWMEKRKLSNNVTVIYPKIAKGYSAALPEYTDRLKNLTHVFEENGKYSDSMDNVFITCDTTYTGHGEKMNMYDDHTIVEITRGYITGEDLKNNAIIAGISTYPMEQEIFLGNRPGDVLYTFIFKTSLTTELIKEGKLEKYDLVESLDSLADSYSDIEGYNNFPSLVSAIKTYIEKNDSKEVWKFLDGFADLLKAGKCSEKAISTLMEG